MRILRGKTTLLNHWRHTVGVPSQAGEPLLLRSVASCFPASLALALGPHSTQQMDASLKKFTFAEIERRVRERSNVPAYRKTLMECQVSAVTAQVSRFRITAT